MIWIALGTLAYLLIGAVLVVQVFGGMSVEAEPKDMLYLVIFWPLMIPFFGFLLNTRKMIRALEELDDRSD